MPWVLFHGVPRDACQNRRVTSVTRASLARDGAGKWKGTAMTRSDWCKHYRGMYRRETCEAGVRFDSLPGRGVKGFLQTCPCLNRNGADCEKAEYRTDEEIAAERAEVAKRLEQIGIARDAIVAALGGPRKRGMPGASGTIDCPVCGKEKSLAFSRSSYNGHIHAQCLTDGCVSWME